MFDPTYQTMHPRTALWHRQRAQCERCAHLREYRNSRDGPGGMRCAAAPSYAQQDRIAHGRRPSELWDYCIDAREPGGVCGPDAQLFQSAVLT